MLPPILVCVRVGSSVLPAQRADTFKSRSTLEGRRPFTKGRAIIFDVETTGFSGDDG